MCSFETLPECAYQDFVMSLAGYIAEDKFAPLELCETFDGARIDFQHAARDASARFSSEGMPMLAKWIRHSRYLVADNWEAILRVAKALQKRKLLTDEEVKEMVGTCSTKP